jgi:hypothetical protein
LQDVGKRVEELGVNTAFFSTLCGENLPLLHQVIEHGALYVHPCCPSPFHTFPMVLGLAETQADAAREFSISEILEATREVIAAAGMQGRISNWILPVSMAHTAVAFMYAVEWLNGRVSQQAGVIDEAVLLSLFGDYVEEMLGERMYPQLSQLQIESYTLSTMFEVLMPFIVY